MFGAMKITVRNDTAVRPSRSLVQSRSGQPTRSWGGGGSRKAAAKQRQSKEKKNQKTPDPGIANSASAGCQPRTLSKAEPIV